MKRTSRFAPFVALVLVALAACSSPSGRSGASPGPHNVAGRRTVRSSAEASSALIHRKTLLGRSVRGRSIFGYELGDPEANERALVVGCIHGTECAGIPITRRLIHQELPRLFELLLIPDLNPDGFAANTRQNGRGVDLNRNFPYQWVHEGQPWSLYYSGPKPLSEPETRIARRYILDHRPDLTFWFHQHENLVWASGGNFTVQRCFARLSGLRFRRLPAIPGSGNNWTNHVLPGHTSTVVELPVGTLPARRVARFASAIRTLARWDAGRPHRGPCPA